jgi:hypothetical protein
MHPGLTGKLFMKRDRRWRCKFSIASSNMLPFFESGKVVAEKLSKSRNKKIEDKRRFICRFFY